MKIGKLLKSAISHMMVWATVIAVLCIAFLVTVSYEATKASVQVTQNGQKELIRTHADTIDELLSELNVTVQQHDELSHNLSDPVEYGMDVTYIASKSINLAIDRNHTEEYFTTASTVEEFFEQEGLEFKERDELSHDPDALIEEGMDIKVQQAFQVTVNDGGKSEAVWTTASTVDELLQKEGITLNELDELNLNEEEELSSDKKVMITRVEKVTDIVEEEVDFTVETKKDHSLPKGEKKVVSNGEKGLITKEYEVILKNGEEASRELVEETVEQESKTEVVALGTKVEKKATAAASSSSNSSSSSRSSSSQASTTVSRNDTSGAKTLYMHATAYTANCAGCSGITATGINLKANPNKKVVAVDPNVIPLGSRVWVEGYGYAIAGDTGGAINGNRIDLFVSSRSEALKFGSRNVKVKILD
ncbi:ubiquitin-like domain-containing protein [Halobacillus litoralis]|uniref:G5 and 3D domain-containing protein n=1 Tax=Halobacillus litoralis TaxID=45668 RepID=UPI001CFE7DF2|nr:G5 and 3D domain-containing protein [Halobacillus litoralis]WLR48470.1 ubiquitin-like domain-containing protein [Halobacillus litoralis]